MKKNVLFVFFALFYGMILMSCGTKADTTSPKSTYNIQEWIQVGDYDILVHELNEEQDVIDGKRLVYLEFEYANNRSSEELSCRRNQWYLYDKQGYSYEAESSGELYDNKNLQYLGGDRFLNQGMQLRGWLVFRIPENASFHRIQFVTGFLDTETADIIVGE